MNVKNHEQQNKETLVLLFNLHTNLLCQYMLDVEF